MNGGLSECPHCDCDPCRCIPYTKEPPFKIMRDIVLKQDLKIFWLKCVLVVCGIFMLVQLGMIIMMVRRIM